MKKLEERLQKHVDLLIKRYPALKALNNLLLMRIWSWKNAMKTAENC